jgi:cysteine-rich repeat protein
MKNVLKTGLFYFIAFTMVIGNSALSVDFSIPIAQATVENPEFVEGNPSCSDLGYDNEFKIEPPVDGTYPNSDGSVTIVNGTQGMFDWSSTFGIDAVIAKGGPNANVYSYNPSATSGFDLSTPINDSNGLPYGLSHVSFCYNDQELPYPVPVVDAEWNGDYGNVLISWDEITDERLQGYKVVFSETNPNPEYPLNPGDVLIQWIPDPGVTSYNYAYNYLCDTDYHFSMTARYDSGGHYEPGNAITLNFACEEPEPSCEDADAEFVVDLEVMGLNCGSQNLPAYDYEDINLSTGAGSYDVYTVVHRSGLNEGSPYGQDNEEFTLRVNSSVEGPVVLDQPPGTTWQIQNAGTFDFIDGTNTVHMDTAFECLDPQSMDRNSVAVTKLCLYEVDEPEEELATVIAHKIVCDEETDLPNWSGGANITVDTAQNYVDTHPNCRFASDWKFEWGTNNSLLNLDGDYIGEHNVAGWYDFDSMTDINGKAEVELNIDDLSGKTWFREVLQDGYVPFSFPPGSNPGSDVSAEFWCNNDVVNYDNAEWINNIEADDIYYCVAFNVETPSEYSPYCGDGIVNQEWEECEIPLQSITKKDFVGCSEQCQYITPECSDLTLAKINVDLAWNKEGGNGDMTSDLFLGSDSYRIPSNVWFALYWNGNHFIDPAMDDSVNPYEDVPGMAVQRLENSLRTVMYGTQTGADKEHVHGNIEFYNATVDGQRSDNSNDYPGNNRLEEGFDGYYNPDVYQAGDDEVWVDANMSYYWLTTTTADDGYYTDWTIIEDCDDDTSICGVKFEDKDKDANQGEGELNLSGWTINLYEKYSCQEGDEWADEVVAYNPGPNVPLERSDPNQALGVAENNDTMNFVSLGIGGELILGFDNLIENGSGDDIQVIETSWGNPSCDSYPEYVRVYASQDGNNWTDLGSACQEGDPTFDLGSLPWAKYVKLVDESSSTPDGFDVDGVRAINCLNASQEALATEVTTENGYCFEDLEAGHYMVCEEMQEGWTNSTPLCQQVMLEEDDQVTVDFGNYFDIIEPVDPAPWCSALMGALKAYYDPSSSVYGVYNEVIDVYTDDGLGVINLSDLAMITQQYYEADDEICYFNFEDEEDFNFQCEDPNVGWCNGLVQGVTDFYGQTYINDDLHPRYDLNDDGVVNLSDLAMVAQLLGANDQVACYTYYVPPFLMCPVEKPYCGDGNIDEILGETCDSDEPQSCTTDDGYDGMQSCNMPGNDYLLQSVEPIYCVWNECFTEDYCGDGVQNGLEQCDDGNTENGDGCNSSCQLENIPPPPCTGCGSVVTFDIKDLESAVSCEGFNVSWRTTKSSNTTLDFGTESGVYDQNIDNDTNTKNHSLSFTDLLPNTTYYYKVTAVSSEGLVAEISEKSFTTPPEEQCEEVLGEKIGPEPLICDFLRPSGSKGGDHDLDGVFQYPNGSLLRDACVPQMPVYLIKDQKKFHIPSWKYLHDNHFDERIYNVITTVLDQYPSWTGEVLGIKDYADGTLLRGSDMKIYILEKGQKRHITTLEELGKYVGQVIIDVSDEVLARY